MKKAFAYYVGTSRYSFRRDQPAKIVGVIMAQPSPTATWRPCFKVKYPDGKIDYCPVSETSAYRIVRSADFNGLLLPP